MADSTPRIQKLVAGACNCDCDPCPGTPESDLFGNNSDWWASGWGGSFGVVSLLAGGGLWSKDATVVGEWLAGGGPNEVRDFKLLSTEGLDRIVTLQVNGFVNDNIKIEARWGPGFTSSANLNPAGPGTQQQISNMVVIGQFPPCSPLRIIIANKTGFQFEDGLPMGQRSQWGIPETKDKNWYAQVFVMAAVAPP